ncbi:hypothetical protein GLAREA_07226 [Glarea lozoyensis ATCC 20868]|uniref:Heterokaryon incompatibility domain-containing protein n=1 Tax=Glarea lozoyensis (strain ATCC 20868 / MF5171) TaxID=1116229 RepID=S3E7B0_GLAL2|nr:uncharacterized protein GLAREA_07226 [Glarea lozoyensis ATCC 20868]EPE34213.1 hypothetical protein GLAREA_07226 [Glarea lozoyensis ATCC 20868]
MRLLNASTFEMCEFFPHDTPPYAILSHTWGSKEISFQDYQSHNLPSVNHPARRKLTGCCKQAKIDGIDWVWIDTCCIDKTSSSELSEAINSMYAWYEESEVCYVYLEDVSYPEGIVEPEHIRVEFTWARWFTRGWCLQELLAPRKVEFYTKDWAEIGTKRSLQHSIEFVTGIPADALLKRTKLSDYTIAYRMSWASKRETTRPEDEAYCLLGIFELSMPLIYGEGRRAFQRLQQEIIRQTEDYTFLLWSERLREPAGVLASSPGCFLQMHFENHAEMLSMRVIPTVVTDTGYGTLRSVFANKSALMTIGGDLNVRQISAEKYDEDHAPAEMGSSSVANSILDFNKWKPLQITTRGLHMSTFVRRLNSNSRSLVLWTLCMSHDGRFMCILVEEDRTNGVLRYKRSTDDVILLEKTLAAFTLSELYLFTEVRDIAPRRKKRLLRVPQLDTIISATSAGRIVFIETIPSIPIGHWEITVDTERFFCGHKILKDLGEILLRFKFSENAPTADVTTYFSVEVGLARAHNDEPWCRIAIEPQSKFEPRDNYPQHQIDHSNVRKPFSDRATQKLPNGKVVLVAIKERKQTKFILENKKALVLCHTLYITVKHGPDENQISDDSE